MTVMYEAGTLKFLYNVITQTYVIYGKTKSFSLEHIKA